MYKVHNKVNIQRITTNNKSKKYVYNFKFQNKFIKVRSKFHNSFQKYRLYFNSITAVKKEIIVFCYFINQNFPYKDKIIIYISSSLNHLN